jgi:hypothetical protein
MHVHVSGADGGILVVSLHARHVPGKAKRLAVNRNQIALQGAPSMTRLRTLCIAQRHQSPHRDHNILHLVLIQTQV